MGLFLSFRMDVRVVSWFSLWPVGCGGPARLALCPSVGAADRHALHCARPWVRRPGAPSPPCVGAASGRPGPARCHLAGAGVPPGGACPAGARSISFSAEKETGLHSSSAQSPHHSVPLPCASSPHKSCAFVGPPGPVFGEFGVEHGGLRLYALFGDPSRPLRPSHSGTETGCGSIRPPPACASLRAECGSALRGARCFGLRGAASQARHPPV